MARYILIDNASGYIWGDSADVAGWIFVGTPLEFAAALDRSVGAHGCVYAEVGRRDLARNEAGYHVFRVDVDGSEAVVVVEDGTDQEMIEAVTRDCAYVTTIRCTDAVTD